MLPVKFAACGIVGVLLAWQVVSRSVTAYLASTGSDLAVTFGGSDPLVLSAIAAQRLETAQRTLAIATVAAGGQPQSPPPLPKAIVDEVRSLAERALITDPLNPRTLRILGQIASETGDQKRAKDFMTLAVRQSRTETIALLWLMQDSYDAGDFASAAMYADVILRTRSGLDPVVIPVLTQITEKPAGRPTVQALLAANPPWRPTFFRMVSASITDAQTPMQLLLGLKTSPTPAEPSEYAAYLKFLLDRKLYDYAFYTWLQSLSPAQLDRAGLVHNGHFVDTPSNLPFDWSFSSAAGVSIERADVADQFGRRGLRIEFSHGRVEYGGVSQLMLLPPGNYRLTGKFRGELVGRRGLEWQIFCDFGNYPILGRTPMFLGTARTWTDLEANFQVPATDCRAQRLKLVLDARSASEQLITGKIWYDEIAIVAKPDETSPKRAN